MRSFIINVNGEKVCSISLTAENTRGIHLSWIGSTKKEEDLIFFHIGGMDENEHVDWSAPQLKVGDEITIQISEDSAGDPPTSRKTVEQLDHDAEFFAGRSPNQERKPGKERDKAN
jgi:hypothetical protein